MSQPIERQSRIDIYGSPTFSYTNTALIASGAFLDFDLEGNLLGEGKYLPLDSIVIKNSTGQDLTVAVGSQVLQVPNNAIVKKTAIAFRRMRITNIGAGNATANKLFITAWKEPINQDELIRRKMARKLRFFGL